MVLSYLLGLQAIYVSSYLYRQSLNPSVSSTNQAMILVGTGLDSSYYDLIG